MRIAIVDDSPKAVHTLKQYFHRYQELHGGIFDISEFNDGLTFLDKTNIAFDIVLFDIDMPLLNGMDAACKLRERDDNVCIIFITNLAQYAIQGYEVNALDFIVKPLAYSQFEFKIQKAIALVNKKMGKDIVIKVKNGAVRVLVDDISYIEVVKHKVIYHTRHRDYESWDSMKNVEIQLAPFSFARCNVCYLVNLNHVTELKEDTVCVNGAYLKISNPKRKEFINALMISFGGF